MKKETQGFVGIGAIIAVVALLAGLGVWYSSSNQTDEVTTDQSDKTMMQDDGASMEGNGESMVEEDTHTNAGMESEKMMESEDTMMKETESMMESDDTMMQEELSFSGTVLAGSTTKLLDYTSSDYQKAVASDKLVVLYFYANWCPTCKQEVADALYPAFNGMSQTDVVGFRVNYNDSDTDDSEKERAREFGVAYQHTKVFVKNGERILKSPESWNTERYLSEIEQAK